MMNVGVCMNVHTPFYSFFYQTEMKSLKLKIQDDYIRLNNVKTSKMLMRNDLLDQRKVKKKNKDVDAVKELDKAISKLDDDLLTLNKSIADTEIEFEKIRHKIGKIRLNCYLFADIIYNSLIEYSAFLDKYSSERDEEIEDTLKKAIDNFKKLPFEIGEDSYLNSIYSEITDRFLESWGKIRDGVVNEVLAEVDKEYLDKKKK